MSTPMGEGRLRVVYGAVDGVVSQLGTFHGNLDQTRNDLFVNSRNLVDQSFRGMGSEAFDGAQRIWDQGTQEIREAYARLQTGLGNASVRFQETDQAIAARFG